MTNAEKQKRYREKQKALRSGGIVTEVVTGVTESVTQNVTEKTKTDRLFEESKPGYWIFEDGEPWERECWRCGDGFETRLELNRFCGPECKEKWLRESFRAMSAKVVMKGAEEVS